jgi:hypothetical protein
MAFPKKTSKMPIEKMTFEPADNGGFISRTHRPDPPRKSGDPYVENVPEKNVHPTVQHAAAHLVQSFPGGKKKSAAKPAAKRQPTEAASIGSKMLGQGDNGANPGC